MDAKSNSNMHPNNLRDPVPSVTEKYWYWKLRRGKGWRVAG